MSDLRKAAEMALDALDIYREHDPENIGIADAAHEALRQALAQPEQKPVAWLHELSDGYKHCVTQDESGYVDNFTDTYKTIPLYTAPPKREWVGLTDEEIEEYKWMGQDVIAVIKEVQETLKEKNT